MTPVYQTQEGPFGNCYAACLASILECGLEDIPELRGYEDWGDRVIAWMKSRGWDTQFIPGNRTRHPPRGLAIKSGRTLTGWIHAVVCRKGKVIHDPSPRPYPILKVVLWTLLRPIHATV